MSQQHLQPIYNDVETVSPIKRQVMDISKMKKSKSGNKLLPAGSTVITRLAEGYNCSHMAYRTKDKEQKTIHALHDQQGTPGVCFIEEAPQHTNSKLLCPMSEDWSKAKDALCAMGVPIATDADSMSAHRTLFDKLAAISADNLRLLQTKFVTAADRAAAAEQENLQLQASFETKMVEQNRVHLAALEAKDQEITEIKRNHKRKLEAISKEREDVEHSLRSEANEERTKRRRLERDYDDLKHRYDNQQDRIVRLNSQHYRDSSEIARLQQEGAGKEATIQRQQQIVREQQAQLRAFADQQSAHQRTIQQLQHQLRFYAQRGEP